MSTTETTLAERITTRVADHDPTMRAAVGLACTRLVLPKIGVYVERDGWIDWPRLACDLICGVPWSGGEKRLARIACSLSGQLVYLNDVDLVPLDGITPRAVAELLSAWSLAECLYGLDDDARAAVVDALHLAAGSTGTRAGDL